MKYCAVSLGFSRLIVGRISSSLYLSVDIYYVSNISVRWCRCFGQRRLSAYFDLSFRGCFDDDLSSGDPFVLVMGTFCIDLYVVCHGLCSLYIVFLSGTILAKTILEDVRPYKQRPNNSEPMWSQQVSAEVNTADIN